MPVNISSAELSPSGSIVVSCDSNGAFQLFSNSSQPSCNGMYNFAALPPAGRIVNPYSDPQLERDDIDTPFGELSVVVGPTGEGSLDLDPMFQVSVTVLMSMWG